MPIPQPTGTTFATNYNENTMGAAPVRTSRASLKRLKYRYRNVNLETKTRELCAFLRANGDMSSHLDKYRVAERALYPNFGAAGKRHFVDSHGNITPSSLETAIYYWIAACDESREVTAISSSTDRKQNFLRALYESQRGNNNGGSREVNTNVVDYVDNGSMHDSNICSTGTINKLCELFVGSHPDIELIAELNSRMLYLIKGFLAQHLLEFGCTIEDLAAGTADFDLLEPRDIQNIRDKVIYCLGGLYTDSHNLGLVGTPELRYITESTTPDNIQYIDFSIERATNDHAAVTVADVNKLIVDANEQLRRSQVLTLSATNTPLREFPYDSISRIIKSSLPEPSNGIQAVWENNLGLAAPIRNYTQQIGFLTNFNQDAAYLAYYDRREREREAALQAQPTTLTAEQCSDIRADRHQHRGMKPKY